MATLTRTTAQPQEVEAPSLTSSVPSPFPRELLQESSPEELRVETQAEAGPSHTLPVSESNSTMVLQELIPSIAYVEKTLLMTLNNLLSGPTPWNPIVPDRRHSMPTTPVTSTSAQNEFQSSSALQTLVSNLRTRDPPNVMLEIHGNTDAALLHELRNRVDEMSDTLEPSDAHLAESIVALLSHFNRLSAIYSTDQGVRKTPSEDTDEPLYPPGDLFNTLKRQLSDLQVERLSTQQDPLPPNTPPVVAVEKALLWSKIDEELETVVAMCKDRSERFEHLPPQYDVADYEPEHPPQYDTASIRSARDDSKSKHNGLHSPTLAGGNEKMRMDLEAVAMAIDRLYLVAPQLHNQRVELKSSKLAQMEKARRQGSALSASAVARGKQKQKDDDTRDLENILELIGKASERTLTNQSVILDGGMKTRLERARQRDVAKREAFVGHLAEYSDSRRLHGQDAVLQPSRTKNPEAMLTLPEFIREAVPSDVQLEDPKAMLTLPEFVKEMLPPHVNKSPPPAPLSAIRKKPIRTRSMSAPSLSWLRPSSSRSVLRSEITSSISAPSMAESETFAVTYVAEHHENLQHILVFLTVSGATPGVDIVAEVLPSGGDSDSNAGGDYLVVKSGPNTSLPLCLPGRTTPGKKQIKVQGSHYELKLTTLPTTTSPETSSAPLLDATQLTTANPSSFICASCSLPLVQSSKVQTYKDLPSDHWEELVDAWMCHTDQKLNERVMKHGKSGFWPEAGQALVGGSYILFEEGSMVKHHLSSADSPKQPEMDSTPEALAGFARGGFVEGLAVSRGEDWRLVRCLCGAVVGRCQEHQAAAGTENANVFRMLKYAIRPVSSSTEPSRLPLSAFIVEDMTEFVEAHASYRFIILDEEDERPRILIWLFKPSMRIAYTTQTQYSMPRSASIHTAKVLYKLLGPSEAMGDLQSILNTYPGFPQAEYLFYPMDICRRLAVLLKESNGSYPDSMRTMTGLEVGWLRRA
ncbi:HECT-like ubiquitin-conjugating enzyme-binding-domain-containing protein [Mycena metata]|uniref:HECT-like ubiquitin-conjugating enzyme-binding-domain-containing protein n=1 Tax=Mycena metata TaxID=1033252 RepID=A0AAD7J0Y7_9AGAR|nr:HECT-like ubiquitin-conjugating enzyme-binding-domain-containing protein [Mycena metata]